MIEITVLPEQSLERIDRYLAGNLTKYSRTYFATLIAKGHIAVNGAVAEKASQTIKAGDCITITFPKPAVPTNTSDALKLDIRLVYEHEHFLIVYKGAGIITHKPTTASTTLTLVDWLHATEQQLSSVGSQERPGIIHRLDKDTSGLLIIARTNYAHMTFGTMFKQRAIQKTYLALVQGTPEPSGSMTHGIGRSPFNRTKMAAFADAAKAPSVTGYPASIRAAHTDYTVLNYFDKYALVQVKPLTGRTHQIRVHCAAIGHPIVGDTLYGTKSTLIARQALHAYKLAFAFDNTYYAFYYDIPEDFSAALDSCHE